jgi:hypothetical protein
VVVAEVAETVVPRSADGVEAELREVGLWPLVRDYLPPGWQDAVA